MYRHDADSAAPAHIAAMQLIRRSADRDLRIDFFRGLALWWIFTDHIPGDVLGGFSLRNFAACDATEIFVLLAGYGAGLSYGMTLESNGYVSAAADVLKRAWVLYIAHIFLFVLYAAQVTYSATTLARLNYLEETKLNLLGGDPYGGLAQAILLRFQPSLLNILPLYVALMVMFAATLWLLRWPRVLFSLSAAGYVLVRITGYNFTVWDGGGWFFDPLAWQFLFTIGVLLACAPMRKPPWPSILDAAAAAIVLTGVVMTVMVMPYPARIAALSHSVLRPMTMTDKTLLSPFRVVSILAFTWLVVRLVPFSATWLRCPVASVFVLLGQNSLPVFCAGIVIGFAARTALDNHAGWLMQVAINAVGGIAMVLVGALAAWYRIKGRTKSRPAVAAAVGSSAHPG